jgi:hypothetical protein
LHSKLFNLPQLDAFGSCEAVFGIPKLVVCGKLLSEGNEDLGSIPAKIQLLMAVE